MRLFTDMDGTLAKWNNVEFEQLFEKGYYRELEPNKDILEDVRQLVKAGYDVYILSCVLPESKYALEEKKEWLREYLPELPEEKYIFVPYGQNKADYLRENYSPITESDYLVDDYTQNLLEWRELGGTGVKYLNGINHTRGTWDGDMIYQNRIGLDVEQTLVTYAMEEFVKKYGIEDRRAKETIDGTIYKDKATQTFVTMLETIGFTLEKHEDGYCFVDDWNEAEGIEDDRFDNAAAMIDRLSICLNDYYFSDLEEAAEHDLGIDFSGTAEEWVQFMDKHEEWRKVYQHEYDVMKLISSADIDNVDLDVAVNHFCPEEKASEDITYKGKEIFWSVESEGNSYRDDEYNGSYNECVEYATKMGYTNSDCQISRVLAIDGVIDYCYDTVDDWNEAISEPEEEEFEME